MHDRTFMKSAVRSILLFACVSALPITAQTLPANAPVKILCMGDSVMVGYGTDASGINQDNFANIRRLLYHQLIAAGIDFDFVGTQTRQAYSPVPNIPFGTDYDMNHGAHAGWAPFTYLCGSDPASTRTEVAQLMNFTRPNIVLIYLGINGVIPPAGGHACLYPSPLTPDPTPRQRMVQVLAEIQSEHALSNPNEPLWVVFCRIGTDAGTQAAADLYNNFVAIAAPFHGAQVAAPAYPANGFPDAKHPTLAAATEIATAFKNEVVSILMPLGLTGLSPRIKLSRPGHDTLTTGMLPFPGANPTLQPGQPGLGGYDVFPGGANGFDVHVTHLPAGVFPFGLLVGTAPLGTSMPLLGADIWLAPFASVDGTWDSAGTVTGVNWSYGTTPFGVGAAHFSLPSIAGTGSFALQGVFLDFAAGSVVATNVLEVLF